MRLYVPENIKQPLVSEAADYGQSPSEFITIFLADRYGIQLNPNGPMAKDIINEKRNNN